MKLVINVPDYIKEQADDGKGEEFGIPLWLAYEIANGTPLPKGHGRLIDENEIDTVVNGVFSDYKCSPKNFLNAIHSQCIEVVGADRTESEE